MSKFNLSNPYQKKLALARLEHFLCASGMIERLEKDINDHDQYTDRPLQLTNDQVSAITRWVLDVAENIDVKSKKEPNTDIEKRIP